MKLLLYACLAACVLPRASSQGGADAQRREFSQDGEDFEFDPFDSEGSDSRSSNPGAIEREQTISSPATGLPAAHVGAVTILAALLVWVIILLSTESEPSEYTAADIARLPQTHTIAAPLPPPPPPGQLANVALHKPVLADSTYGPAEGSCGLKDGASSRGR